MKYLGQKESQELDQDLMTKCGFINEQLMELAGLSVANVIFEVYPVSNHQKVLIVCGPGNNGGDGMVAARHLSHFGYDVAILYPKKVNREPFIGLVTQCECLSIKFLENLPADLDSKFNLVVDAIFGYSFSGNVREPFDRIIKELDQSKLPLASIDVPSGWNVEEGNSNGQGLHNTTLLISLTAPKLCAKSFTGAYHYLGGRFIPKDIEAKYNLDLPVYQNTSQFVKLSN